MTIKSILCLFAGAQSELNALNTALVLGETYGAQVRVLHVSPEPTAYVALYGEGIIASAGIIATVEKENKTRMEKAQQYVVSFAAKHHLPLDKADAPAHHASVRFIHMTGMIDATIAREGRLSDLIVMGKVKAPSHDLITPALFNTGRPVLLMPPAQDGMAHEWLDKTVALAWNGSMQSARALYNALPLLRRTEELHVLAAHGHGEVVDLESGSELMRYLNAHGLMPDVMAVDCKKHSIGDALLAKAKELKSDLLVMGAYGRSMFSEMILGGVTEHMLEHADIPLLLSH